MSEIVINMLEKMQYACATVCKSMEVFASGLESPRHSNVTSSLLSLGVLGFQ